MSEEGFDRSKPYGEVLEVGKPNKYVQDGVIYDNSGKKLGEDPSVAAQKAADQLMEAEQKAKDVEATKEVLAVEERLGMEPTVIDPGAEATRENAAALQAESAAE